MKFGYAAIAGAGLALMIAGIVASHQASAKSDMMSGPDPTSGYTIHIDADKHFSAHPDEIIHHWCKKFADGSIECALYNGDGPDARLVGAETIVSPATYNSFSAGEQARWHYHKIEIPKLHATTPGLTADQSKALVASLMETYGKVFILWDPMTSAQPIGEPSITILK
jgi:hypothetical protein